MELFVAAVVVFVVLFVCLFFQDIIKVNDEKSVSVCFAFLIMLLVCTLAPLILLSVDFGLPRENLVTSTI